MWLLQAGRGFGKTRVGAEWVLQQARENPGCRIALVGAMIEEARRIMVEGESGLIACSPSGEEPRRCASRGELKFKSGAVATLYSGARDRGAAGDGDHARENGREPRPATEGWHVRMEALYRGTRLGARELDGELTGETEGALWSRALIDKARVSDEAWGAPERIVIGVDPPATSTGDACLIVACGRVTDGRLLVLADLSCRGLSPAGWASRVADAAAVWGADKVVVEANNGGDMILQVLGAADFHLPVAKVHAHMGKSARRSRWRSCSRTPRRGWRDDFRS